MTSLLTFVQAALLLAAPAVLGVWLRGCLALVLVVSASRGLWLLERSWGPRRCLA